MVDDLEKPKYSYKNGSGSVLHYRNLILKTKFKYKIEKFNNLTGDFKY